jgi:hypothetical protein
MSFRSVPTSQCLDKRLQLLGFEVPDLLAIFLTLSILNFIFGQTNVKFFLVWLPTLALAATLYFGKRGKPDNYLLHWLRFQIKPGTLSAFPEPSVVIPPPQLRKKD